MIVADTDVLIDFLAGEGAARRVALELEARALATTAVSRFELQAGARSERQRALVARLLEALPTLPLDARAADRAAEVRVRLEAQGRTIGMADSLIAGMVLAHGGLLLTRNLSHFELIEGLVLARLGGEG